MVGLAHNQLGKLVGSGGACGLWSRRSSAPLSRVAVFHFQNLFKPCFLRPPCAIIEPMGSLNELAMFPEFPPETSGLRYDLDRIGLAIHAPYMPCGGGAFHRAGRSSIRSRGEARPARRYGAIAMINPPEDNVIATKRSAIESVWNIDLLGVATTAEPCTPVAMRGVVCPRS